MKKVMELRPIEPDDIVSKIKMLHLEVLNYLRLSLEKAIQIGELLTEQKSRLKHGEWLPWINENLSFSQPSVFNYMNLYKNRDKLLNVNNLSEAYKLLKGPKPKQIDNKKSLLDICNFLKNSHILFKEEYISEATNYFYFDGDKVSCFSGYYASVPYQTDFKIAVNGYNLHKIISEIINEEPTLEIDNYQLKITSKLIRASLNTESGKEFDMLFKIRDEYLPPINENKWKPLPEDFMEGVRSCYFTIDSNDCTNWRYNLSIDGNLLVSTDHYRISRYYMEGEMDKCFIERSAIESLLKFETDFKFYQIVDKWIFFKDEFEMVFGAEIKLDLDFSGLSKHFDFDVMAEFDLPRIPIREIFMMKFFASGDFDIDRRTEVYFHDNRLILKSADNEKGWIEREYVIKYDGEKINFFVNPVFLSEVMPYSLHCRVGEDRVLFSSESYEHLIELYSK